MDTDLIAWGKAIRLETTGRRSGLPRVVTVSFVEAALGSLLVAASTESADWAANLRIDPTCTVERDGDRGQYTAVLLDASDRAAAITQLILRYGTPAERLGAGPAFRLEPRP